MSQPQQSGSFEHIPLASIRPSSTNPRKHFAAAALEELTQSVRELGVTVPITVRSIFVDEDKPLGERLSYEIVTGERRYRAAQAAGLEEIPAIVHDGLSDADAMDLQMVENLQRADLHPVEEAEGYRALLAHGATAEDVAKKAGKTLGYVQQRLKLLALEVEAKKLFADGHLTLGHALLLARLTAADQIRALVFLLGIAQWEIRKEMPVEKLIAARVKNYDPKHAGNLTNKTEQMLSEWIRDNVLLQLKGVPWDLGDAELLPVAGPCTTCPKRTGANAALFADLTTVEDTCVDPACFADKQKAFTLLAQVRAKQQGTPLLKISAKHSTEKLEKPVVEIRASAVKLQQGKPVETQRAVVVANKPVKEGQWVGSKQGACPATVQAIATDGPDRGKLRWVCADQACKVHHHHVQPTRAMTHGVSPTGESYDARQKREQEERKREEQLKKEIDQAVAAELMKVDAVEKKAVHRLIGFYVESSDWAGDLPDLCYLLGISIPGWTPADSTDFRKQNEARAKARLLFEAWLNKATPERLARAALAVLTLHAQDSYDEDDMGRVGKMFDVDAQEIGKEIRARAKEEAKAAAKAAKPAPAAKKASAKKKSAPIAEQLAASAETVGA